MNTLSPLSSAPLPPRLHTTVLSPPRQQSQGLLPPGTAFDLFRGTVQSARDEVEAYPTVPDHEVRNNACTTHICIRKDCVLVCMSTLGVLLKVCVPYVWR